MSVTQQKHHLISFQIKYAINEDESGRKRLPKTPFTEGAYDKVYKGFLEDMQNWDAMNPVAVRKVQQQLWETAK
jgi:hypothetical protein